MTLTKSAKTEAVNAQITQHQQWRRRAILNQYDYSDNNFQRLMTNRQLAATLD